MWRANECNSCRWRKDNNKESKKEYNRQWAKKNKDKRNASTRKWRERNLEYSNELHRKYNAKSKARNYQLVKDYLSVHPCVDCGETDIMVLEFDHEDPTEKKYNISHIMTHFYSVDILMAEIKKCSVRCSNCHKRKTHRQQNTGRVLWSNPSAETTGCG